MKGKPPLFWARMVVVLGFVGFALGVVIIILAVSGVLR